MPPTPGASRGARVLAPTLALAPTLLLAACGDDRRTAASAAAPLQLRGAGLTTRAMVELHDAGGTPVGEVELAAVDGGTRVTAEIEGLDATPGFHGFHVHANDDPANGSGCAADPLSPPDTWFTAVDGHLGAGGAQHGDHRGDLPSLLVTADGRASASFVTDRLTLDDLAGRAMVVHAGADNFGNVPVGPAGDEYQPNSPAALEATADTGNAGDRIACGIVTP
jgi:Cu-Zn family superoxide dismutase